MNRDDEFIGTLENYLDEYEGMTPLPDAIRDAIRAELPTTKQIGPLTGLMRNLNVTMNLPPAARYGLLAAVAVAAVLVGAVLFGRFGNTGGEPDATPTPTPIPTPAPPPLAGDTLDAGTYSIVRGTLHATITVPAGWGSIDGRGVGSVASSPVVIFWPFPDDFQEVYSDPCHWKTSAIDPPVGPTVDDLANALADQALRGDAVPTDVTIGGYNGKLLEMSVPSDIDFATCDDGYFYSWVGRYHQGPGQIDNVYILDVNGTRQVLIAHYMPGTPEAVLAEQQAIVESIDILP
jgi:hypothetical protein